MKPGDKCIIVAPAGCKVSVLADNDRQVVTLIGIIPRGTTIPLNDGEKLRIGRLPGSRVWWEIEEELTYFMHGNLYQLPLVSSLYLKPLDHQPAREWFTDYFKKAIKV